MRPKLIYFAWAYNAGGYNYSHLLIATMINTSLSYGSHKVISELDNNISISWYNWNTMHLSITGGRTYNYVAIG